MRLRKSRRLPPEGKGNFRSMTTRKDQTSPVRCRKGRGVATFGPFPLPLPDGGAVRRPASCLCCDSSHSSRDLAIVDLS